MKATLIAAALVMALAACSKTDKGGGEASSATGKCAEAVAKAVQGLPAGGGGGAADVQAKLEQILTARCTEDKWPAATVECYAGVKDMMGMKTCRETLPAEQQQQLMTDIRTVMMGAAAGMRPGGAPMGNPHGGAPPPPPAQ